MSTRKTRKTKVSSPLKQTKLQDMFSRVPDSPVRRVRKATSSNAQASSSRTHGYKGHNLSGSEDPSDLKMAPKRKPAVIEISSDSSEQAISPPSTHVSKRRRVQVVDSESEDNLDGGDTPLASSSPLKQPKGSDSDSSNVPSRSRRIRKRLASDEEEDNADSDNLVDEVDPESILQSRLRGRGKLTKFQQNLEKLKKRKANAHNRDTDEEESDDSVAPTPFFGAKPSEKYSDEGDSDEDEDDDASSSSSDFIVEDSNTFELPLQFSRESHADLSHQFKKVFQLFVHIAVQKPGHRAKFMKKQLEDEEYFAVPLNTMRRKLSSLRDSLVSSSVWKPDFKSSVENYPELELVRLEFAVPFCDACHLGGRMSTLLGRLTGYPYNQHGFETLKNKATDEKKEFHLGRFCARRTRVYHQFTHWERALFRVIVEELDELRGDSHDRAFHRVAFIGGKEPPKDLTDADEICEWLDQRKVIDMEWRKIEEMMESARHLEVANERDEDE